MDHSKPSPGDLEKMDEQLTAYLDGELVGEPLQALEQRLASDELYRQRLQLLDRSWNLLDKLPKQEVDQKFAATTVEMVALHAADAAHLGNAPAARRMFQQQVILGLSVLAACLLGFVLTRNITAILNAGGVLTNRNDTLLENLPILENYGHYSLIDDIEFVRSMSRLKYFSEQRDSSIKSGNSEYRPETADQKRMRVDRMEPAEQKALLANHQYFERLDAEEQIKLRTVHQQLINDPKAGVLFETLSLYYDWYQELDPEHHVELQMLPRDERIEYIEQLLERRDLGGGKDYTPKDIQIIARWLGSIALQNKQKLLRAIKQSEQMAIENLPEGQQRRRLTLLLWKQWNHEGGFRGIEIDKRKYRNMKAGLSRRLREKLEKQATPFAEIQYLLKTARGEYRATLSRTPPAGAPIPRPPRTVSPDRDSIGYERLRNYFNKLPKREQERLNRLSRKEFIRELQRRYRQDRAPSLNPEPRR